EELHLREPHREDPDHQDDQAGEDPEPEPAAFRLGAGVELHRRTRVGGRTSRGGQAGRTPGTRRLRPPVPSVSGGGLHALPMIRIPARPRYPPTSRPTPPTAEALCSTGGAF